MSTRRHLHINTVLINTALALALAAPAAAPAAAQLHSGSKSKSPMGMTGSLSLNWRNVGPREPIYETQIQNQVYLADIYWGIYGPSVDGIPFAIEFNMPTGGQGQPNLYQFYFEFKQLEKLEFQLGKFLVPFGRYNELYRPDMFLTVTRPLLYASPDSLDLVVRINSPRPPFSSGYTDIGARASWYPRSRGALVPSEWTFFVVNGLSENSNRSRTFPRPDNLGIPPAPASGVGIDFGHENNNLADNNNNKAVGTRLVYSIGSLDLPWPIPEGKRDLSGVSFGISGMDGRFDLEGIMYYRMVGFDFDAEYEGLHLSAEYMWNFVHQGSPLTASSSTLVTPTVIIRDPEIHQGYFVQASYPIMRKPPYGKRLTGVAVFNQMFRRGSQLDLRLNQTVDGTLYPSIAAFNQGAPRISTRMDKVTGGLNWQVTDHIISKFDFSYWFLQRSTNEPRTDIYQGALSLVLAF